MKKTLLVVLIVILGFSMFAAGDQEKASGKTDLEKTYTLKLAHNHNEGMMYFIGAEELKEIVESKTNGKVIIDIYPSGQLGADADIQEGVMMGTIDMGVSSSPVANINDYMKVLDAPYLFVDREHVTAVLDGDIGKKMAAPLRDINIEHLGYWENGFRHITNNRRPIVTPEDLRGIKLRTPESPVRMAAFRAWGANPVPMAFSEVFSSLQQGIFDGQENPLTSIYNAYLHEVQKYLSLSGHVYSAAHLLINKKVFESLPLEYQTILSEAGKEIAVRTREIGKENRMTTVKTRECLLSLQLEVR